LAQALTIRQHAPVFQLILPFQLDLPFETGAPLRTEERGSARALARRARPKRARGERSRPPNASLQLPWSVSE
jgi:hypothetical protein